MVGSGLLPSYGPPVPPASSQHQRVEASRDFRRERGQDAAGHLPASLEIFSSNGSFRGTLHLHEYLGRLNPRGVLPDCIEEAGTHERMKPSDAEVRAGNGSFKNWKVSFKTMYRGQVVSIKDLLDVHNLK